VELTAIKQLWVADITYIRLEVEFVYLAVILDAFSRRMVGWALDSTLEATLAITALRRALARRHPAWPWLRNSEGARWAAAPRCTRRPNPRNISLL